MCWQHFFCFYSGFIEWFAVSVAFKSFAIGANVSHEIQPPYRSYLLCLQCQLTHDIFKRVTIMMPVALVSVLNQFEHTMALTRTLLVCLWFSVGWTNKRVNCLQNGIADHWLHIYIHLPVRTKSVLRLFSY